MDEKGVARIRCLAVLNNKFQLQRVIITLVVLFCFVLYSSVEELKINCTIFLVRLISSISFKLCPNDVTNYSLNPGCDKLHETLPRATQWPVGYRCTDHVRVVIWDRVSKVVRLLIYEHGVIVDEGAMETENENLG